MQFLMSVSYLRDNCGTLAWCARRQPWFGASLLVSLALLVLSSTAVLAQATQAEQLRLQGIDPSLLQQLQRGTTGLSETGQTVISPVDQLRGQVTPSGPQVFQPLAPVIAPPELSRLEIDYAERLMRQAPDLIPPRLEQFGYRMLGSTGLGAIGATTVTAGAINDSYRLGIGDELVVTFRGQVNQSYRTSVDREGLVVLPDMAPIPAAGRSFAELRAHLEQMTGATFLQTDVFVSLGTVRNFPILVLGHVQRPGMHRLTGVSSIIDAIVAAGGVQKSGSLRHIQVARGSQAFRIDLYDLLLTGRMHNDLALMEGDRVFVPALGPTLAVVGDVQNPGIFELKGEAAQLTATKALELAGGTLRPGGYRYLEITAEEEGGDRIKEIEKLSSAKISHGDILAVSQAGYSWEGAFFLDGHVSVPGPRALNFGPTVAGVVNQPDVLLEDPYLLFGVLETTDPETNARYFRPVDLKRIADGNSDVPLSPMDRLIIFGMEDILFLSSPPVQEILTGKRPSLEEQKGFRAQTGQQPLTGGSQFSQQFAGQGGQFPAVGQGGQGCRGLEALAAVVSRSRSERYASALVTLNPAKGNVIRGGERCPEIYDRYPELLPFVLDYVAAIRGEIRVPGIYPIAPETPLASLVPVVGGLSPEADLSKIELTKFQVAFQQTSGVSTREMIDVRHDSLRDVAVGPGDIVRFNPRFSDRDVGSVFLTGEFKRPGVFSIRRGERLSELITRAGGLTEQAYPLGTVFTRARVRQQETMAFERLALDLESGLAEALTSGTVERTSSDPQAVVAAVQELANKLRRAEPVGRVVVEADPTVLGVSPELDTILEPGDAILIPKRPNSVTVSGEVLSPGTIQFRAGKTVDQYIDGAGGFSRTADDGRTFIVLPNGEAQRVAVSSWNYTAVHLPPGSTIIVPRDPKPFDWTTFSITATDILSKLAITAASLSVINNN